MNEPTLAKQLRELREKATPGRWGEACGRTDLGVIAQDAKDCRSEHQVRYGDYLIADCDSGYSDVEAASNVAFIAFCGTHALAIATALDDWGRENETLRDLLRIVLATCEMHESLRSNITAALSNEVNDENVCH